MSRSRSVGANGLVVVIAALSLGALLLLAVAAACASKPVHEAAQPPTAHVAGVLAVRDEGHLRFVHASGSVIIDEGAVAGTFPGSARVRFLYNGEPDVSAQFTLSGHSGSVSARGTGTLSDPTSPSPSFKGHMTITGGTGRYAHIHGGGELFGVYYRRSYALTVQAIGKLPY